MTDEDGAVGDSQEGILSSFVHVARLLNGIDADHVPIVVLSCTSMKPCQHARYSWVFGAVPRLGPTVPSSAAPSAGASVWEEVRPGEAVASRNSPASAA